MANGINKAIIVGRLGQDPDVKYMPSGTAVANLSVATSEQWKDKQTGEKQEKTEWHKVTLFARLAEVAGEYLAKGSLVYIEGRIQTDKWTDKDGIDRYTTKIIGNNMQMLGSKNSASAGAQKPADSEKSGAPQYETGFDDDIPF